ncbi:glutathione S-transferase [Palleronia aestuarii]|uniref:Glutathione S-transferase n=1 Tax=Palleronia aestuarii TaxID=568105 RepID=A0A2W7N493_9RHOB|nr:glutathione S-transferase family protein [Palleronia aestuarii]PZX14910.1 glutathione S-transferase [Palleronia aestuarii]
MPSDPVLTVFRASPDGGRGLARDMPVRWALEEVGRSYDEERVSLAELKASAHRARHPFGQIPTFRRGDLMLFESGAIVLSIARRDPGLLPTDETAAERVVSWMFAALTTIEPPIVEREQAGYLERDRPWFAARQALLDERIRLRLGELAAALGQRAWLEGEFSAADLIMITVLRRLEGTDLASEYRTLADYVARGTARPAYLRAFRAQKAAFDESHEEVPHAH